MLILSPFAHIGGQGVLGCLFPSNTFCCSCKDRVRTCSYSHLKNFISVKPSGEFNLELTFPCSKATGMTAKHTSIRETMFPPIPAPFPKILFPNPTPIRQRKTCRTQAKERNETCTTTQLSTKLRTNWHTAPPAGRAMMNRVRMIFCSSGV